MGFSTSSHPAVYSLGYVWDVGLLEWVVMTQPSGGGGDATAANQVIGNASLASIDGKTPALVGGRVPVDGSGVTQPVSGTFWQATQPISAVSLPLPTGASTAADQATANASLATIAGAVTGTEMQVDVLTLPAITGSVTANAGTNLNTSALNLETTQADVRTALQVIDDWDESDRAKVNPIVGQAGVQAGAGAVSANTQRVALATDANVVNTKTALTASSPTAVTVGTGSGQIVASNANRKGLVLVNTSANTISLGLGGAAILNSGITLLSGASWTMNEYTFFTGAINGIASAGSSNIAVQEFT